MTQVPGVQPIAEEHKQRCPTRCNSTLYYYVEAGISLQCRHCKGVVVIPWEELLQRYRLFQKEASKEQGA